MNMNSIAPYELILPDEQSQLLTLLQHNLNSPDPWFVVDEQRTVLLNSKSGFLGEVSHVVLSEFTRRCSAKLGRAFKKQTILHVFERLHFKNYSLALWVCIEPIRLKCHKILCILHVQIIDQSTRIKHLTGMSEFFLASASGNSQHLLEPQEQLICDLLREGYTQEEIARQFSLSRSSLVRKVIGIASQLGLGTPFSTAKLRRHLRG